MIVEATDVDEWTKADTLSRAAEALRRLERPDRAQQLLEQVLAILDHQRPGYTEMRFDDAKVWDAVLAKATQVGKWYQAEKMTHTIRHIGDRVWTLSLIISDLIAAEQYDQALSLSRRAAMAAQAIQDPAVRSRWLSDIAINLAQLRGEEEARLISDAALALCESLSEVLTPLYVSARTGAVRMLLGDTEQACQVPGIAL